jgi:hypothetical protein
MFDFVSFFSLHFVSFRYISFRFDRFRFASFGFVSFRFVRFRFVSFGFASFLFRFALYRYPFLICINAFITEYIVPESIIRPVVNVSVQEWLTNYIFIVELCNSQIM